jgi:mRNA-degrading endonuclease RelE of RelBE toxin-antitoxin system
MSYKILSTTNFAKQLKQLLKKYPSLRSDLDKLKTILEGNPKTGTPLGKDCFKIRISITSKGKGKSGGGRIITYVKIVNETIYLLTIYDKSERETISSKELQYLIDLLSAKL